MTFFWFSFDFEIFELIKRSSHIFQKSANRVIVTVDFYLAFSLPKNMV